MNLEQLLARLLNGESVIYTWKRGQRTVKERIAYKPWGGKRGPKRREWWVKP